MSSLFMCCTLLCVCVCVLRFHCERGFVKNGLGHWFLDDVPDPLKRISIPPIASLSVHRRDFFSSGSNWTKRLERPERKEKKSSWKGTKRTFDTLPIILEESFKNAIHVFKDSYEYNPSFHPSSIVQKKVIHINLNDQQKKMAIYLKWWEITISARSFFFK